MLRAFGAVLLMLSVIGGAIGLSASPAAAWGGHVVVDQEDCDGWAVHGEADPSGTDSWTYTPAASGDWSGGDTVNGTATVTWSDSAETYTYDFSVSKPGDCTPPPPVCPDGTDHAGTPISELDDNNGDGSVNEADCNNPPPPPAPEYDVDLVLNEDCDGNLASGTVSTNLVFPDRVDPLIVTLNGGVQVVLAEPVQSVNLTSGQLSALTQPYGGYFDYASGDGQIPVDVTVNEAEGCEPPPPPPNNHPECVDYKDLQPGDATPVYGEVWIKAGSGGDNHGHYSIGVQPAGYVIPDTFNVPGEGVKDVSHADVCQTDPPPPPPVCPEGSDYAGQPVEDQPDRNGNGMNDVGDCDDTPPPPPPPVDECPDLPGNQPSKDECPPPPPPVVDVCPNIDGNQSSVPAGMVKDAAGNCVTPPPPGELPKTGGSTTSTTTAFAFIALVAGLGLLGASFVKRRRPATVQV